MRRGVVCLVVVGCSGRPTPTGTVCPDPDPMTLAYSVQAVPGCVGSTDDGDCGFGQRFMATYCTTCHASDLPLSRRNGAPLFHDFDSLFGVLEVPDHIDEQAGSGPRAHNAFMPGARCPSTPGGPLAISCPQPTDDERAKLSLWLACERNRTHDLVDAGVPPDG